MGRKWMSGGLLAPVLWLGMAGDARGEEPREAQQPPPRYQVGDRFVPESLPAPDGGEVDLAQYRWKGIFLVFFASW